MRAVNLIPSEQRRGGGAAAGRTGGVSYVIAGALAALVALGAIYALTVHTIAQRKTTLANVGQQIANVQAQASTLSEYVQFGTASAQRTATVVSVAEQRFDWPRAMAQLALALPSDVTLTSLAASGAGSSSDATQPAGGATGATGATGASGSAAVTQASAPVFTITGCASSHDEVATVLIRIRALQGLQSAMLQTSAKNSTSGGGSKLASGGGCPNATFNMTLTYATGYGIPNSGSGASGQTVANSAPGKTR